MHHPTSGLNSPPFSVARVFCISLQYFHLSALPLTVPLQKAALVSAYSVTGKPLLFVSLFHRRCKQRKALCIRGLKHFLPTLFVHPSSCFKEDKNPATLDSTSVAGFSTNSFCPITQIKRQLPAHMDSCLVCKTRMNSYLRFITSLTFSMMWRPMSLDASTVCAPMWGLMTKLSQEKSGLWNSSLPLRPLPASSFSMTSAA